MLSKVPKAQREELGLACEQAADAVVMILDQGMDAAMQQFNASS